MDGLFPFSRASLVIDLFALVLVLVIPIMLYGIYLVRYRKEYSLHRRVMLWLSAVLGVVILVFEIDVRINGWQQYAQASPYRDSWMNTVLVIHLIIAITSTILWICAVRSGIRYFKPPVRPNEHSFRHKRIAKLAAGGMCLTVVSGLTFFWVAFVAK